MNREIKFRVWYKSEMHYSVGPSGSQGVLFPQEIFLDYEDDWEGARKAPLMQYTGLHDKNGKEIYEGDIVSGNACLQPISSAHFKNVIGVVEPIEVEKHFAVNWKMPQDIGKMSWIRPTLRPENQIEIIGNIFENPNLLS